MELQVALIWFHFLMCRCSENNVNNKVSLAFVGDISFGASTRFFHHRGLYNYSKPFEQVVKILRDADLAIGNYESVITSPAIPLKRLPKIYFRVAADSDSVTGLRYSGFDIVSLANNHIHDYGEAAANFTLQEIKKAGINPLGYTSGNWNSPQEPLVKNVNGIKIGLLAYCITWTKYKSFNCTGQRMYSSEGAAAYTEEIMKSDIKNLKKMDVDITVVFMHWGTEHIHRPLESQRRMAIAMSNEGVNIIVGCHPHWLQTHEYINKTLVVYSLGNFLFGKSRVIKWFYDKVSSGSKPLRFEVTAQEQQKFFDKSLVVDDDSQESRILKVTVNKTGIVHASYLPCEIRLDANTKCLQPTPKQKSWINICSSSDTWCNSTTVPDMD